MKRNLLRKSLIIRDSATPVSTGATRVQFSNNGIDCVKRHQSDVEHIFHLNRESLFSDNRDQMNVQDAPT